MSTIAPGTRLGSRWSLGVVSLLAPVGRGFGQFLFPPVCCLCGFHGLRPGVDLCGFCIQRLPLGADALRAYPPVFSRALVPYLYDYPLDQFIRRLKFRGERHYARVLGTLLARAQTESGAPTPQLLIPVPLHASRYRSRGFNQAAEIARFAAAELGARVDDRCLTRVIATREQSGLPLEERMRNVRGAFRACRAPEAKHVALFDDVLTTGNTMAEAGRALAAAGGECIELWAMAHVPGSKGTRAAKLHPQSRCEGEPG